MIPYLYKKAKREYKKEIRMNKKKKFGNLEIMIKDDTQSVSSSIKSHDSLPGRISSESSEFQRKADLQERIKKR